MKKTALYSLLFALCCTACSKSDPILPGERTPIFPGTELKVLNTDVPNLPENAPTRKIADCPYTQDSSNIVWDGTKKIFSGFPTSTSVKSNQKPVCSGNFVYAGLTTGELVKINRKSRNIEWIADIYRTSNMTGGATVLDIVAPIVIDNNAVYTGGLGDAFCKLQVSKGTKIWCLDIGIAEPFLIVDKVAFVVGTNNTLYAINTNSGDIYWAAPVKSQMSPVYKDKTITVGRQKFNTTNGKLIK